MIIISERWAVDHDKYNIILIEKTRGLNKRAGKMADSEHRRYFGCLRHVAEFIVTEETLTNCTTLKDAGLFLDSCREIFRKPEIEFHDIRKLIKQ